MPAQAYHRGQWAHGCTDPIAATDPAMTTPSATSRSVEAACSQRAAAIASGSEIVPAGVLKARDSGGQQAGPDE